MKNVQWIKAKEALVIHDRLIVLHGGSSGLRDNALLESALARPKHHATYKPETELPALAAIYTSGIVQNHPFIDGNKRTGFVLGILFLEINGLAFSAKQEEVVHAVMALAEGKMSDKGYAAFLSENTRSKSV
ncbi:putative death on curing protein [Acetobacteraceae bacterium EV16G]|uniref:Death on curing protein n=1 Tax=Sorlinia euscelidii TaxID=3081148 RepID=A0ABU7U0B1_9PROT